MRLSAATHLTIVVPAHDEERYLGGCVERLLEVASTFPFTWRIVIADSGSTDATWDLARELAAANEQVDAIKVELPGRGRALRAAWSACDSDLVAYTDTDLSGDPRMLVPMVRHIHEGADLVIGSRLVDGADVERSLGREVMSRTYSQLLHWATAAPFRDAQCGLKVIRAECCKELLPLVRDEDWFFDTELLLNAWARGMRIDEVAVPWVERRDSRVRLAPTIGADLAGILRVSVARIRSMGPPAREVLNRPGSEVPRREAARWAVRLSCAGWAGRRSGTASLVAGATVAAVAPELAGRLRAAPDGSDRSTWIVDGSIGAVTTTLSSLLWRRGARIALANLLLAMAAVSVGRLVSVGAWTRTDHTSTRSTASGDGWRIAS